MTRGILHYQNRIDLMKGRSRENGRVIRKCERKIKQLKAKGEN